MVRRIHFFQRIKTKKDEGEFGCNAEFAQFAEKLGIKYDEIPSFDYVTFSDDESISEIFITEVVDQGELRKLS